NTVAARAGDGGNRRQGRRSGCEVQHDTARSERSGEVSVGVNAIDHAEEVRVAGVADASQADDGPGAGGGPECVATVRRGGAADEVDGKCRVSPKHQVPPGQYNLVETAGSYTVSGELPNVGA